MARDIKMGIEVDDEDVQRAEKRIQGSVERMSKGTQRMGAEGGASMDRFQKRIMAVAAGFFTIEKGVQVVTGVFDRASAALQDYNDRYDRVDTITRRLERSKRSLGDAFAREVEVLSRAVGLSKELDGDGSGPHWIEAYSALTQASIGLVKGLVTSGNLGGAGMGVVDSFNLEERIGLGAEEAQSVQRRLDDIIENIRLNDLDSWIAKASLAGPERAIAAEELRLEQAIGRIQSQARKAKDGMGFFNAEGQLIPADGSLLKAREILGIYQEIDLATQRAVDAEKARSEQRQAEIRRAREFADVEQDIDRRSMEVQTMALEGMDREAALARVRLAFDREELKLKKELAGVDEARLRTELEFLASQESRQLAATRARLDALDGLGMRNERSAAIGVLGGKRLVVQQLGTDAQATTAQNTAKLVTQLSALHPMIREMIKAFQAQPGAVYR